jgi:protein-S-isoprenylcysteine O-methyltransferase Ste14
MEKTHMDSRTIFRVAFFFLLGLMLVVRIIFNLRLRRYGERFMPDREALRHEGVGLFVMRVVLFFVLVAILVLYAIDHSWMKALDFYLPAWMRWLGFAIGLLSIALTVWIELELGRQFSPQLQIRSEHQLITHGPYAHIRHPLYTALFGFGLSLALLTANWFFVAFFLVFLVGLLARVPKEERMLLDQFGEEYEAYLSRTGRFFPKV